VRKKDGANWHVRAFSPNFPSLPIESQNLNFEWPTANFTRGNCTRAQEINTFLFTNLSFAWLYSILLPWYPFCLLLPRRKLVLRAICRSSLSLFLPYTLRTPLVINKQSYSKQVSHIHVYRATFTLNAILVFLFRLNKTINNS
jgi:hypothetical protein